MKREEFETVKLTGKILEDWYVAGLNVMLIGKHGVAKTAHVTQLFESKCPRSWVYFSAPTLDPWIDLIGIPKASPDGKGLGDEVIRYVRPEVMNESLEAIFIDEYNRSHKKVRNAVMELIQFKRINGKHFPNLKVVWVACNPGSDDESDEMRYDVEEIDDAQLDRFHIVVNVDEKPCKTYFTSRFSKDISDVVMSWYKQIPKGVYISPRRLEYAVDAITKHKIDAKFLLPKTSNPRSLQDALSKPPLLKALEKATPDAIVKEFCKAENEAEIFMHFQQNENFRNSFKSHIFNYVNKDSLIAFLMREGVEKILGLEFTVDSVLGLKKIAAVAGTARSNMNVMHPNSVAFRFLLENKGAFFNIAVLREFTIGQRNSREPIEFPEFLESGPNPMNAPQVAQSVYRKNNP